MDSDQGVYQQVMRNAFNALDTNVAQFHRLRGHHVLQGHCTIRGAEHPITRALAVLLRLPTAQADAPFRFELEANADREIWTRHFPQRCMRSRLSTSADGMLIEQLGPAQLQFSLHVDNGRLSMQLRGIRLLGLPWPRRWFPKVWAYESGDETQFCFDVGAGFSRLGLLTAYRGYLEIPKVEHVQ